MEKNKNSEIFNDSLEKQLKKQLGEKGFIPTGEKQKVEGAIENIEEAEDMAARKKLESLIDDLLSERITEEFFFRKADDLKNIFPKQAQKIQEILDESLLEKEIGKKESKPIKFESEQEKVPKDYLDNYASGLRKEIDEKRVEGAVVKKDLNWQLGDYAKGLRKEIDEINNKKETASAESVKDILPPPSTKEELEILSRELKKEGQETGLKEDEYLNKTKESIENFQEEVKSGKMSKEAYLNMLNLAVESEKNPNAKEFLKETAQKADELDPRFLRLQREDKEREEKSKIEKIEGASESVKSVEERKKQFEEAAQEIINSEKKLKSFKQKEARYKEFLNKFKLGDAFNKANGGKSPEIIEEAKQAEETLKAAQEKYKQLVLRFSSEAFNDPVVSEIEAKRNSIDAIQDGQEFLCNKRIEEVGKNQSPLIKNFKKVLDAYNNAPWYVHMGVLGGTVLATASGVAAIPIVGGMFLGAERLISTVGAMGFTEQRFEKSQSKKRAKLSKQLKENSEEQKFSILNEGMMEDLISPSEAVGAAVGADDIEKNKLKFLSEAFEKMEKDTDNRFAELEKLKKNQAWVKWGATGAIGLVFAAGLPEKMVEGVWNRIKSKPGAIPESVPNSVKKPSPLKKTPSSAASAPELSGKYTPPQTQWKRGAGGYAYSEPTLGNLPNSPSPIGPMSSRMMSPSGISPEIVIPGTVKTPPIPAEAVLGKISNAAVKKTAEKSAAAGEFIVETPKGGSIWSLAKENLAKQEWFSKLTGGDPIKETYIIDSAKKAVLDGRLSQGVAKEGLNIGEKVNLNIIKDSSFIAKMENAVASRIQPGMTGYEHISEVNSVLKNWARQNPGEMLTTDRARRIVAGLRQAVVKNVQKIPARQTFMSLEKGAKKAAEKLPKELSKLAPESKKMMNDFLDKLTTRSSVGINKNWGHYKEEKAVDFLKGKFDYGDIQGNRGLGKAVQNFDGFGNAGREISGFLRKAKESGVKIGEKDSLLDVMKRIRDGIGYAPKKKLDPSFFEPKKYI
ncbi:MAG: hypothetical protein V1698_00570 [bacterium]